MRTDLVMGNVGLKAEEVMEELNTDVFSRPSIVTYLFTCCLTLCKGKIK